MKRYAIYDLKSGHILKTHGEMDLSGRHKELAEEEVLSTLDPHIARDSVGVAAIDIEPSGGKGGASYRIDPHTRKLIKT
jgi:hypothetical protein